MNKKEIRDIYLVLKDFSKENAGVVVCMVVQGIVMGVKPFIAVVLTGLLVDAVYSGEGFRELMIYSLLGVGFGAVCQLIDGFMQKGFFSKLEYMHEIQAGPLNEKALKMDYEYLEDVKIHDMRQNGSHSNFVFGMIGCILSELSKVIREFTAIILGIVIALPMLFGGNAKEHGWWNAWYVSLLFLIIVIALAYIGFRMGVYFNEKHQEIRKKCAIWQNKRRYYMDVLASSEAQKDMRVYGQQAMYQEEVDLIAEEQKKICKESTTYKIANGVSGRTMSILIGFLVYAFAGWKACAGIITLGNVVTYANSILRLTNSISQLVTRVGYLKEEAKYAGDYVEFMNLGKRKYQGTIPLEKRRDNKFKVEFQNVSFKYPGSDQYVIKDLNLSFVIGEKMAIVGKNGSGKTTFIKLLCRLYDVTEGCIKVNGIDIRKYNYQEYCDLFGVVFQDFRMFAFPLGENIAASDKVDEARAMDALERAGLGERVVGLSDGLNTYVGKEYDEEGVNFSGGEKQKMAIARAIYKDAPFVIMDEPTAALDPESECEVFAGFDKMVGKKTAIYISHRLASCRFCEDILVFDKGQVVQRGSHEELEAQPGLYRELWNAQAQYYRE